MERTRSCAHARARARSRTQEPAADAAQRIANQFAHRARELDN